MGTIPSFAVKSVDARTVVTRRTTSTTPGAAAADKAGTATATARLRPIAPQAANSKARPTSLPSSCRRACDMSGPHKTGNEHCGDDHVGKPLRSPPDRLAMEAIQSAGDSPSGRTTGESPAVAPPDGSRPEGDSTRAAVSPLGWRRTAGHGIAGTGAEPRARPRRPPQAPAAGKKAGENEAKVEPCRQPFSPVAGTRLGKLRKGEDHDCGNGRGDAQHLGYARVTNAGTVTGDHDRSGHHCRAASQPSTNGSP